MTSAAFPAVVAALCTVSTNALASTPDVRVIRGRDISQDPGDSILIGVSSTDETAGPDWGWASVGRFDQEMHRFHGPRLETGTVNCLARASSGDEDMGAVETRVFGYLASIEAALRADPTAGLTGYDVQVVVEFEGGDVMEAQDEAGVAVSVAFTISYRIGI